MTDIPLPKRIFMATDLSARSDRALARAAQLARAWNASLAVTHAVEAPRVARAEQPTADAPAWRRPEPRSQTLERRLRADLEAEGVAATASVVLGSAPDAVLQAAADSRADLVVLGIAKDAPLDRVQHGSTTDAFVRRSRLPVLNVRSRARGAYRHVVVASDFSEPARHALQLAARWFAGARLTLFHAYLPPGSSPSASSPPRESWRKAAEQQCAAHVAAAALAPQAQGALQCVLEHGQAGPLLANYVDSTDVDLVVLGSQGRSGIARALLGSTAENMLHSLDCDTLVVRSA
jgi:nucleotide-binding universal stress UspA family protein